MLNIRIMNLPTLNRALATGDKLAIDSGSGNVKVDFATLKQQVNGITLVEKSITSNGLYDPANDGADGYSMVNVQVGGGGSSGIYVGTDAPDPSFGSDGNYYYQRKYGVYGCTSEPSSNSNTLTVGYEFQANINLTAAGVRGYSRYNTTGGLALGDSSGNVLKINSNIAFSVGWNEWFFDTPVQLASGSNYVVYIFAGGSSAIARYQPKSSAQFSGFITGICGRYNPNAGNFPNSSDNSYIYSADIILGDMYHTEKQFYKASGAWWQI